MSRPNVVFVFADDQRFDGLAMSGDQTSRTPHLDQLAKEGVFFNHACIVSLRRRHLPLRTLQIGC